MTFLNKAMQDASPGPEQAVNKGAMNINALKNQRDQQPQPEQTPNMFVRDEDLRSSTWEVRKAQFMLARTDTTTELVKRWVGRLSLEDTDDMISPDEVSEIFPELEGVFSEPVSMAVAQQISNTALRRKRLNEIIQNGDPDSMRQSIEGLGLSIAAHIVDPIGIMTGMAIGKGATFALGKAMARGGVPTRVASGLTGTRRAIAEGAGGNFIEEIVAAQPLMKQEMADINILQNATISGLAGAGFAAGVRGMSASMRYMTATPERASRALELGKQQLDEGMKLRTKEAIDAAMHEDLPNMRQLRDQAVAGGNKKRADELDEQIKYAENNPPPSRGDLVEEINSPRNHIDYDAEVNARADQAEVSPIEADIETKFANLREQAKELEFENNLSPEFRKALDDATEELGRVPRIQEAIDTMSHCFRRA